VLLRQGGAAATQTVLTDETGGFHFAGLPAGKFLVRVTARGFAAFEDELTLASGESGKVEWVLRLASVAEQVVVTAARITGEEEAARLLPGTVNVLDRQTLESSRVFTFTEALRKVPGLFVRDEEGFGLRPNIGIRGLNPTRSSKVLLLEDGIPLAYAPYGDNASYYHPPIDRFEEVEVLKGSGQILYGPSTVGGVINYITPSPPGKSSGSVRLLGGNREYFNGRVSYGGTWGNTGLLLDYLRKQDVAVAVHPQDMDADQVLLHIQRVLQRDYERHRFWLAIDTVGLLLSWPLTVIPGPNVLLFYFLFRVGGHWMSMRGANRGRHQVVWNSQPNEALDGLRAAVRLNGRDRQQQVQEVASALHLRSLPVFFNRVARAK